MKCEYAACDNPGPFSRDGWDFCRGHLTEHHALMADDDNDERLAAVPMAERIRQVRDLLEVGYTNKRVARALGLSLSYVYEIRAAGGFDASQPAPARCGTRYAYRQHKLRGEHCPVCAETERAYKREWDRTRRGRVARQIVELDEV